MNTSPVQMSRHQVKELREVFSPGADPSQLQGTVDEF